MVFSTEPSPEYTDEPFLAMRQLSLKAEGSMRRIVPYVFFLLLVFLACCIPVLLAISWMGLRKQER